MSESNVKKRSGRRAPGIAKRTALGGMTAGLGVVVMYLGSVFGLLDISASVFASILLVAVISECGRQDAFLVFLVTSALSWLLLPNRSPALMYTAFLGYYPIIKPTLDRMGRVKSWIFKLALLNAATTAAYFVARFIFTPDADDSALLWVWYPLLNAAFVLYDKVLAQMIRLWILKLRKIFGFGRK